MNDKLKEIETENDIWLIYIFIIFLSWYANSLEKDYFITNNQISKEKYRQTMIYIFSVLIIIYTYFFKGSYDGLCSLNKYDDLKKYNLTKLSAIASLLILISGLIYLYIAYNDNNIDVEIAFN